MRLHTSRKRRGLLTAAGRRELIVLAEVARAIRILIDRSLQIKQKQDIDPRLICVDMECTGVQKQDVRKFRMSAIAFSVSATRPSWFNRHP
jgi:hypothetical protein